jgi:two-component system sensor histidine kinase UhpB
VSSAERDRGSLEPPAARDELAARIAELRARHLRVVDELRDSERRFRALARRVWRVQEEERRRLARELHDGVGQMLTALKNELGRLAAGAGDPARASELASAAALAAETLDATREISRLLRPSVLDDLGLVAALRGLARSLAERTGFDVDLRLEGPLEGLPPEIETLLFRVAQEGLTNALKHSGAAAAELVVTRRGDRLTLAVADEGRGAEPGSAAGERAAFGAGIGLRGVRDRVEAFGGRFRFDTTPGTGARLTVELTLDGE